MDPAKRTALVNDVKDAVDGTFNNSNMVVQNLVNARVRLNKDEVNAIMASFLMEDSDARCIKLYGERFGHEFLKQFGAKVPRYSVNQLRSNGLGKYFHEQFIACSDLFFNQELYSLFCSSFNVGGAGTSIDAALNYITQQQIEYVRKLKVQLKNKQLFVMTGIGVSLGLVNDNRLTWTGLLNEIRTMLNNRVTDIIPDADWVGEPEQKAHLLDKTVRDHFAHLDYRQFVSVIMREILPPINHPLALAISHLDLPIATTNYDLLLDYCLGRFEKNLSNIFVRFSAQHHHEFVYHVHGVWFDSNSVVLSNGEYERTQYEFEYAIGKLFFDSGPAHRSLLFIGSGKGMVDPHFSALYTDPRFSCLCHFALLTEQGVRDMLDVPEFFNAVNSGKLIPVIYGGNYNMLQGFLEDLVL